MWLFCWFLGGTLPKLLYVSISNFDYMVWSSLLYIKGSISYASPYPLAGHSFPSWPHPSPAFSSYFTCFNPYIRAPQPLGHRRGARLTAGSEWLVSKSKASSVFTATPYCLHYFLSPTSCQRWHSHRSVKSTSNWVCKRSRLSLWESSRSHPCPLSMEKFSPMKLVPGAKKVGHCCLIQSQTSYEQTPAFTSCIWTSLL